jgi:DNA repair protein RadA/Sms
MLLAVLEKRCSYNLAMMDVFVNIAGGLKTVDTATDLGIASAIASSLLNKAIPSKMAFAAEIGLSGEVRNVSRLDMRIQEAEKLGFTHFMLSADADIESKNLKIKLLKPETVSEAFDLLFS